MIAMLILAAATVAAPQTPQAGALAFLQPRYRATHPVVRIVASTPRYAVVKFSGAEIEGQITSGEMLVQKFAFGWQAVDLSTTGTLAICSVRAHVVSPPDLSQLRSVLSASTADCPTGVDADQRDLGSAADVSAVRALMISSSEVVPFVRVVKNYAFVEWFGNGGGENFYKKTANGWSKFAGGGGAYRPDELHNQYGVPLAIAKALLKQ